MIDSRALTPPKSRTSVLAYLSANPDTNGVLTLGPVSADPTHCRRWKENGMAGEIYFGTFDLGEEIVKGIKDPAPFNGASISNPFFRPICQS